MIILHKLIRRTSNSQQGFILIVALMAVVILTAVGFFALTMISGDLMISAKLTCERKAFSAAESGMQAQIADGIKLTDKILLGSTLCINVDPTNDPSSCYIVVGTSNTHNKKYLGGMGTDMGSDIYDIQIQGKNNDCGSSVTMDVGMVPPGAPSGINIISGTAPGE